MMTALCLIFGLLCLAYYAVIVLYSGMSTDFAWIWVAAGIVFLVFSLILWRCAVRRAAGTGGKLGPGLILAAVGCLALFSGWFGRQIISGMSSRTLPGLEYVIVLGAHVKGKVPSNSLVRRLETALDYAKANPDTILILSGGRGEGEDITEAECMSNYLIAHGIGKERLIEEANSTSTRENLQFSDTMTGCGQVPCGIVSNNFHICRALKTAWNLGYQEPHGISAPSNPVLQVHYIVREIFALARDEALQQIQEIKKHMSTIWEQMGKNGR